MCWLAVNCNIAWLGLSHLLLLQLVASCSSEVQPSSTAAACITSQPYSSNFEEHIWHSDHDKRIGPECIFTIATEGAAHQNRGCGFNLKNPKTPKILLNEGSKPKARFQIGDARSVCRRTHTLKVKNCPRKISKVWGRLSNIENVAALLDS